MIHDKLVRAAKRIMQEIEENSSILIPPRDYSNLKAAVDELENDLSIDAYFSVVAEAGENLMNNLDIDAEYDLENQFMQELHDLENEHPWVLDDDKAILILQYSEYPSAEPATFGTSGCLKHIKSQDAFPWGSLAAIAFVEDVKHYLYKMYDLEVINNDSLLEALS